MTELLRNKVGDFVTKNARTQDWESIRALYGAYTYLAFLCLAVCKFENAKSIDDVIRIAKKYELETQVILEEVVSIEDAKSFVSDILDIMTIPQSRDIGSLYQEYLSVDFMLKDDKVVFEEGKNSRDVLGSYYTQEEFAYIITRKAFDDYLKNNSVESLKIADYSCGGATFLLAAMRICKEMELKADIYGYDVDPVAVLIARVKTIECSRESHIKVRIFLGNPLLPKAGTCAEKFSKSLSGRYYNANMGITPVNDVDIVLGNPPWEKVRFEEKKFLHHFFPNEEVGTKTQRDKLLKYASTENAAYYKAILCDYEAAKKYLKQAKQFEKSSSGEVNTYALFAELCETLIGPQGIAAIIVKSSLVKMPVYKAFFYDLLTQETLYDLFMFTNRNKIFNIDSREEFSVIYMSHGKGQKLNVALDLSDFNDFNKAEKLALSCEDLSLLNPETGMMPNIRNAEDLKFLVDISKNNDPFGKIYSKCKYGRLVHLTNHSDVIKKKEEEGYLPIYEGKFIEQYTGKYASFNGMTDYEKYKNKASARPIGNPQGNEYPESRFFIEAEAWKNMSKNFSDDFIVAWRSLTSATNRRTMLATILPLIPTCQSIQMLQLNDERQMLHLAGLFNSIVFDYIVRLKMVGLDLTQTILKQIPVPKLEAYEREICFKGISASFSKHIISRLKELYKDDNRVIDVFAKYDLYPVEGTRKEIISDIDHLVGDLYGLTRETLTDIANSFDAYYSKEEVAAYFG